MVSDKKFLELRHNKWFARVTIPPSLRAQFGGKQKLMRSLKTSSLAEAQRERYAVVAEFKNSIKSKHKSVTVGRALGPEMIDEAVHYGRRLQQARDSGDARAVEVVDRALMERVWDISDVHGQSAGLAVLEFSEGLAPITAKLDAWLEEARFTARTKDDHRLAVKRLSAWMVSCNTPPSYDLITNESASLFIEEALVGKGANHKTANKLLSGLRTYWKWLKRRGYVLTNPWDGKSLPKQRVHKSETERTFSDEEVVKLFAGEPGTLMRDLMAIAALSGMRLEEIFQLTVADCADGQFNVRRSKTAAGERSVPIHAELTGLIARRCAGKGLRDYLIHEARTATRGGTRSMAFSKRFTTYRRTCGVDERLDGKRRSRVNFHSFRRWFITKADQAGQRREDIERVVGHKVQGMSLGLYSDGVTVTQLRAVVGSVRLPKGVKVGTKRSTDMPPARTRKSRSVRTK